MNKSYKINFVRIFGLSVWNFWILLDIFIFYEIFLYYIEKTYIYSIIKKVKIHILKE